MDRKKFIFLLITTLLFLTFTQGTFAQSLIHDEPDLYFSPNQNILDKGGIQFFSTMLGKEFNILFPDSSNINISLEKDILPLDVFGYWHKKGEENYYILLTKTVFTISQPLSYFSNERLSDLGYLQKTLPEFNISKIEDGAFKMECGFWAPTIKYKLDFYTPPFQGDTLLDLIAFSKSHEPAGLPDKVVIQHNYEYGKVLMHKTSKMSISLSNYYILSDYETLEVNYTLNYIHDIPPDFIGGHEFLRKEIKNGILDLIKHTRKIAEEIE
ncbi:hypothetical protein R9C00_09460 [Flammeovirgaceae bacterium SG7u.111]|nr:hypothetical protein [Flammeovirgaceae bacterium SG7u.132]WPO37676.1 hypothetical protein R9C00_09460 [Flammeovirgaceae bacterium SG7u.111]